MEELYLEKDVADSLARKFGNTSSQYNVTAKITSSSALPNVKHFIDLLTQFSSVVTAYSAMIQQDQQRIQDFISGVVSADQDK